jgi:hypothetical protein
MSLDIFEVTSGDMVVVDGDAAKAGNVLSIQIGDLEYQPEFGIDKKFFLESEFEFQNESFKSYMVQRLLAQQINVVSVLSVIETFQEAYTFNIGNPVSSGGFIK